MPSIAIYEDDDSMRALLKEWLAEAGYHVIDARHAMPPPEPADLVIVSVSMPVNEAIRRVRKIQAIYQGVPVIALSSQFRSGLSDTGASAYLLGVRRLIAKPVAREEFVSAVRDTIAPPS
jgi:DNA-binding response OmpR family regulator